MAGEYYQNESKKASKKLKARLWNLKGKDSFQARGFSNKGLHSLLYVSVTNLVL